MDYFIGWIKGIAVFYILASVLLNLVPDSRYKKYIKLFVGLVTLVMFLSPIGKITGVYGDFQNYFANSEYDVMTEELKNSLSGVEEGRNSYIISEVTKKIQADIKDYVEKIGAQYMDSRVVIDTDINSEHFGTIREITVVVGRKNAYSLDNVEYFVLPDIEEQNNADEMLVVEIKNYFSDFYNLSKSNINVEVRV